MFWLSGKENSELTRREQDPSVTLKPFWCEELGLGRWGGATTFGAHDQACGLRFQDGWKRGVVVPVHPTPPFLIWDTRAPFLRCEVLWVIYGDLQ